MDKQVKIISAVLRQSGLSAEEFCDKNRKPAPSTARFVAYHLLRTRTYMTMANIGEMIGGRDSSVVSAGLKRAKDFIDTEEREFSCLLNKVLVELDGGVLK